MTRTLVLYGTTEGRSGAVAGWLADALRDRGHSVELLYGGDVPAAFPLDAFDAVLVAAPLRDGRYQPCVREFVREHRRGLERVPTAFVSVDPAADGSGAAAPVEDAVGAFVAGTDWTPDAAVSVSGLPAASGGGLLARLLGRSPGRVIGSAAVDAGGRATDDSDALTDLVDEFAATLARDGATSGADGRRTV